MNENGERNGYSKEGQRQRYNVFDLGLGNS